MPQEFGKATEVTIGPLLIVAIDQRLDGSQGVEEEMGVELSPDTAQGELGLLALAADATIAEEEESQDEQNRNSSSQVIRLFKMIQSVQEPDPLFAAVPENIKTTGNITGNPLLPAGFTSISTPPPQG